MSILIVDDSLHIHKQLELFLKSGGYSNLLFAKSAGEAFKQLNIDNAQKVGEGIDLILMDIEMPEIDGIEACRKIKANKYLQDIPIIMVTGKTAAEDLQIAFEAGVVDYITKPVDKIELLARIRSALKLKYEMYTRKAREKELFAKNQELSKALKEIKILSGILPICANCKKIRDGKGFWQQVEKYMEEHTGAQFTHSICDECKEKLYPDLYKK